MISLSLEQLSALNEEILALTRAGVPLESGLKHAGGEMPGPVGRAASTIAARLERGESLPTILQEHLGFPPAYAAVVAAGLRCGRLPAALEGVAWTMRRVGELRRLVAVALAYPCIVVALAYASLIVTLAYGPDLSPQMVASFDRSADWPILISHALRQSLWYWAPWPPVAFLVLLGWIGFRLRSFNTNWSQRSPLSIAQFARLGRLGTFTELLRLMLENEVPLDESVQLAAASAGDGGLQSAGAEIAQRLSRGDVGAPDANPPSGIPPVLGWLLLSGIDQPRMVSCLKRMSETYRQRTMRLSAWMNVYLPMLLSVLIGGSATLAYALVSLGPWYYFLFRLALPQ